MPTLTAHRLSSYNTLFPDRIEIDATNVTYYKGYVFGYQSTVIALSNVASVCVNSEIFFADVVIESNGGKRMIASGFRKSDARTIMGLLTI
jgi:hypothetical protein